MKKPLEKIWNLKLPLKRPKTRYRFEEITENDSKQVNSNFGHVSPFPCNVLLKNTFPAHSASPIGFSVSTFSNITISFQRFPRACKKRPLWDARTHERAQKRTISTRAESRSAAGATLEFPRISRLRHRPRDRDVERKSAALSGLALNFTPNDAFSRQQEIDDRSPPRVKTGDSRVRALERSTGGKSGRHWPFVMVFLGRENEEERDRSGSFVWEKAFLQCGTSTG